MVSFPREEIEAAWRRRMELQDRDDWDGFGQTFTEDAVYVEHHCGTFRGRQAILAWLVPVMEQCHGWTFPVEWLAVDGHRIVHKWQNRLPGQRPDGTYYEFGGITVMEYAGNGAFSYQEDIYNARELEKLLLEWSAARRDGIQA
ncbi:MAG: nuclear transport factor 2 family protein [Deltaproteobacteria bacterium]|nr:nuclear transport factor 2 family protein [Deltaproteobacteria bacterium]